MSGSVIALVIGVLGMAGTLLSALLTQRAADRLKLRELAEAERRRLDDREFEARQAQLAERKAGYIRLVTAARHYHTILRNCYHALLTGPMPAELTERLEEARIEHRARHSEAEMLVPDEVLLLAGQANQILNGLYGLVRRLADGRPEAGEDVESLRVGIEQLWPRLSVMRAAMRADLGVSEPSDPVRARAAAGEPVEPTGDIEPPGAIGAPGDGTEPQAETSPRSSPPRRSVEDDG